MTGPSKGGAAATCLGETQKISGRATGKVKQSIYFQAEWSDVSSVPLFRNHIQMLKLNIWASPLCFVSAPPRAVQSLEPSAEMLSPHSSAAPHLRLGLPHFLQCAGKGWGELGSWSSATGHAAPAPCAHRIGCSAAAAGAASPRASGAPALGPSLGQPRGNTFGTNLNQSFYVLEKMRALHVPRSIGGGGVGAVEGSHSPRGARLAALSCQPHARRASVLGQRFVCWVSAARAANILLSN